MLEISLALKGQSFHSASTQEKSDYSNFNWNIKIMLINICKECYRKASEEIQFWKWGLSKVQ